MCWHGNGPHVRPNQVRHYACKWDYPGLSHERVVCPLLIDFFQNIHGWAFGGVVVINDVAYLDGDVFGSLHNTLSMIG